MAAARTGKRGVGQSARPSEPRGLSKAPEHARGGPRWPRDFTKGHQTVVISLPGGLPRALG
eukprot:1900174-Pyramimonas_sp.AAC.1